MSTWIGQVLYASQEIVYEAFGDECFGEGFTSTLAGLEREAPIGTLFVICDGERGLQAFEICEEAGGLRAAKPRPVEMRFKLTDTGEEV